MQKKKSYSTCVRLTEEQYHQIQNYSDHSGESIPSLLKNAFFKSQKRLPPVSKKDAQQIITAANKIISKVNQIAQKLNTGIYEDWHTEFKRVIDNHTSIVTQIADFGRGKN